MQMYNNHDGSTGKISTSKGNQVKMEVDGYWYKMDYLGYEGLAEYLASNLLAYTNIPAYAEYEITEISLNGQKFNGCRSKDFLKKNEEIVTADRLFKKYAGCSVSDFLNKNPSISLEEKIRSFVTEVENLTKIPDYGKYLTKMLEWDEFILNDDRHFNNIAFVYNSETDRFSICTLFDNGAGFLSDTRFDYPLQKDIYGMSANVKAKPFSESFSKQTEACRKLYGTQLQIADNICICEDVEEKMRSQYGDKVTDRICEIFSHQKYLLEEYLYPSKESVLDSLIREAKEECVKISTPNKRERDPNISI